MLFRSTLNMPAGMHPGPFFSSELVSKRKLTGQTSWTEPSLARPELATVRQSGLGSVNFSYGPSLTRTEPVLAWVEPKSSGCMSMLICGPEGDRASTPCPGIEARDAEGHWSSTPTLEVRS